MRCLLSCVLLLSLPFSALAQTYELSTPARYTYLPSGFVPIAGCIPDQYQCDFDLAGSLTVDITTVDMNVDGQPTQSELLLITDVNFELIGNQAVQDDPNNFISSARVSDLLDSQSIFLSETFVGPEEPLGPVVFGRQATLEGTELRVFIADDARLVDGPGYLFNFTATLVPEPSMQWPMLLAGLMVTAVRRRNRFG